MPPHPPPPCRFIPFLFCVCCRYCSGAWHQLSVSSAIVRNSTMPCCFRCPAGCNRSMEPTCVLKRVSCTTSTSTTERCGHYSQSFTNVFFFFFFYQYTPLHLALRFDMLHLFLQPRYIIFHISIYWSDLTPTDGSICNTGLSKIACRNLSHCRLSYLQGLKTSNPRATDQISSFTCFLIAESNKYSAIRQTTKPRTTPHDSSSINNYKVYHHLHHYLSASRQKISRGVHK